MAELCGVPKSSLESYMKMSGAKRPGVDALIAIADGMNVQLDWLVGRSEIAEAGEFTKEDYAVFCHSTVVRLLSKILSEAQKDPATIDPENLRIMGMDFHDLAAVAAVDFIDVVKRQTGNPARPRGYFLRNFESLSRSAVKASAATDLDPATGN